MLTTCPTLLFTSSLNDITINDFTTSDFINNFQAEMNEKDMNRSLIPRSLAKNAHELIMKGLNSSPALLVMSVKHLKNMKRLLHTSSNDKSNGRSEKVPLNPKKLQKGQKPLPKNIKIVTRQDLINNTYLLDNSGDHIVHKSSSVNKKNATRARSKLNADHSSFTKGDSDQLFMRMDEDQILHMKLQTLDENGDLSIPIPIQRSFTGETTISDYSSIIY